ncbi:flocculation protein FLO11-like [Agrilus planipennis]|uniref:Flocculation protein FLO11-like n=1 Tax=Agrilus planipennis TaxID=224129 RepID=A0A1W4XGM1_AGRPL|nr:flocculation protein FLO11-like [Agrilus planipennis]
MKCFVLNTLFACFLKNIIIASAAEITVIGISNRNRNRYPEKETERPGDVVNININNYCPETSVVLVKECYCVPPTLCRDRVDEQIQAKSKSANLVSIKCNQQEVCCFNVSFTRVNEISPPTPTATPKLTTTTSAPEYVTEIVTTIINVTRTPTTTTTATVPSSSTTAAGTIPSTSTTTTSTESTTPPEEDDSVTIPTEEHVLGEPTKEAATTSQFDVEIIEEQSLSKTLCGTRNLYDRKISRIMTPVTTPASVGEFPWAVSILEKDQLKYECMGSLVRSGVVLTTGNCIQREPTNYVVRAGTINPLRKEAQIQPWQQNDVQYVTYNPQFLPGNGQENGVALLFLKGDFVINNFVNIICLPSNFNFSAAICMSSATHLSTGKFNGYFDNKPSGTT